MATNDEYLYALTDTWNGGTTDFYALRMSVTDAASGAGSKLIEFDINGNPRFSVDKLGNLTIAGELTMGEPIGIESGGTGANTVEGARAALGFTEAIATAITALSDALKALMVKKTGDRMTGALSSAVKDHGTVATVTEEFKYADGNTHKFVCNGAVTINPTGLAEGDVLQINMLYQSGSVTVAGPTQWELGGTQKSASISDVGATLVAGLSYCFLFEVRAGIRTAVLQ